MAEFVVETIGLILMEFLCVLVRKYNLPAVGLFGGRCSLVIHSDNIPPFLY